MDLFEYRPIVDRPADRWPNGLGLAVYIAVGVESYLPGSGHTEDLLERGSEPDAVNDAWREYGNRVGAFRLLDCLDQLRLPPTVLLNTDVYDTAPAVPGAARRLGAEVVGHGTSNSLSLADMGPADELAHVARVAERIAKEEGSPPGGWSSPWLAHSPATLAALVTAGYRYLLDVRADDQPVWVSAAPGPLLAIPYALELNDSTTMITRQVSAGDFAEMIVDEFDELLESSGETALVMSIVLHSFISGVPFRLRRLRSALAHVAAHADRIWCTQPRHIFRAYSAAHPPVAAEPASFLSARRPSLGELSGRGIEGSTRSSD